MTKQFKASEVRDLENRIVQRLSWLREGSPIDMKAFITDIEALLLQGHPAQVQPPAASVTDWYVKCEKCETRMTGYGYGEFPKLCPACQDAAQENPNG